MVRSTWIAGLIYFSSEWEPIRRVNVNCIQQNILHLVALSPFAVCFTQFLSKKHWVALGFQMGDSRVAHFRY